MRGYSNVINKFETGDTIKTFKLSKRLKHGLKFFVVANFDSFVTIASSEKELVELTESKTVLLSYNIGDFCHTRTLLTEKCR